MKGRRKVMSRLLCDEDSIPGENEVIAKVTALRGGSIFDIELPDNTHTLCDMPRAFKNLVWVRRGRSISIPLGDVMVMDDGDGDGDGDGTGDGDGIGYLKIDCVIFR